MEGFNNDNEKHRTEIDSNVNPEKIHNVPTVTEEDLVERRHKDETLTAEVRERLYSHAEAAKTVETPEADKTIASETPETGGEDASRILHDRQEAVQYAGLPEWMADSPVTKGQSDKFYDALNKKTDKVNNKAGMTAMGGSGLGIAALGTGAVLGSAIIVTGGIALAAGALAAGGTMMWRAVRKRREALAAFHRS